MKIQRQTIYTNYLKTIDWYKGNIIDWNSAGTLYRLDGTSEQLQKYHFGFTCDGSITSSNGDYAFIYQKLGTKGLLLKDGDVLKEINRSYYQSAVYEFPAAFCTIGNKTYLVHCPLQYCRLDLEDLETGKLITDVPERVQQDVFHSRLEVSPNEKFLMSKGWIWHPFNTIELFDLEESIQNPHLLDKGRGLPNVSIEICSASFIDNERILVCASNEEESEPNTNEPILPGHIAIWDFQKNQIINPVKVEASIGNIYAIDDKYCWDLYENPKVIEIATGKVLDEVRDINCGKQNSSIIYHLDNLPKIAFNKETKQISITNKEQVEILTLCEME